MDYVEPQCAVVAGGVSKGGVPGGGDLETWRDVDSINNFGSPVVCWWGLFVSVAVADGGDEA